MDSQDVSKNFLDYCEACKREGSKGQKLESNIEEL
jgi:hypothetical protein